MDYLENSVNVTEFINLNWLEGFNFFITKIALDDILKVNKTTEIKDIKIILEDIIDVIRVEPNKLTKFVSDSYANTTINPRVNLDGNLKRTYNVTALILSDSSNIIINRNI